MSILVLVSVLASAQKSPVRVEVGPNVRVSDAGAPHVEPHIAAHPENPRTLIAAVSHVTAEQAGFVETFHTLDGGKTWSASDLPQLREALAAKDLSIVLDTWVTYAPDGTAYCSAIAVMKPGHPWGATPIVFYRSRDQGRSWEGPTALGPYYDRPTLVAAGRGKDKRVYIVAMSTTNPPSGQLVTVLRSDDDGRSFRQTTALNPDNLGHGPMNPVVSPSGMLIVPYLDYARGGDTLRRLRFSRIYIVRSTDGGAKFDLPTFVADIPRPSPGSLEMAVDLSPGRFRGRLYLAWNGESGDRRNVTVARSPDNGETWSTVELSAPGAGPAHFASLAVAGNGTLGVAWIQHEPGESKTKCWRAYFAASVDGGESFTAPAAVSSVVTCPDPIANKSVLSMPTFERAGHYMGLAVATDGTFYPAWPDGRDGPFQVYTAPLKVRTD